MVSASPRRHICTVSHGTWRHMDDCTYIWLDVRNRGEVDEDLRYGMGYVRYSVICLLVIITWARLTADLADWGYLERCPDNHEQIHLFSISKKAVVELRVKRLTEESDVGLSIQP